ncbi:MAG: hypothetical protein RR938_04960 [Muribaculaceae bacterium]
MKNIYTANFALKGASKRYNNENGTLGEGAAMLNLRERDNTLVSIGNCKPIVKLRLNENILVVNDEDIISNIGREIWVRNVRTVRTPETAKLIGEASATILSAIAVGNFIVVTTSQGLYYIIKGIDGEYSHIDINDAMPQLRFGTAETTVFTNSIAQYSFVQGYSQWNVPLSDIDLKAYSSIAHDAFARCLLSASDSGMWVEPMMVRCAVRLHDDTFLWASAPAIVGNGIQGITTHNVPVLTNGNSFSSIAGSQFSIQAYRLGLRVDGGTINGWDTLIKSIEIYTTNEVDAIIKNGGIDYTCSTSQSGERKYYFNYSLAHYDTNKITSNLVNSTSWHLMASITDLKSLRSGIINAITVSPVLGGFVVSRNDLYPTVVDTSTWAKVMYHSVIPATVMEAGGSLHCGAVAQRLFTGWSLPSMSDYNVDNVACNAVITVTLRTTAGNSVVVWTGMQGSSSTNLNAIVAYPDSRATHISIKMLRSGNIWQWEGELMADANNSMAYAVTSDLKPRIMNITTDDTLIVPAEENIIENKPNRLLISEHDNPFVWKSMAHVSGGAITALRIAVRPVATSIFAKYPLYAFTTQGIYALASNSSGNYGEPRCIDWRVVAGDAQICYTAKGLIFLCDGELCAMSGSKIETIATGVNAKAIAWSKEYDELWCVDDNGSAAVLMPSGRWYYRDIFVSKLIADYLHPLAISDNNTLIDINCEQAPANQHISYRTHPIPLNSPLQGIKWHLSSDEFTSTLRVTGENGISNYGDILNEIKITGRLTTPLHIPIFAPQKRTIRLVIEGNVQQTLTIFPIGLNL